MLIEDPIGVWLTLIALRETHSGYFSENYTILSHNSKVFKTKIQKWTY